ncbi:MAG: methyltransferase domain-containing protein [Selenomonadaceae bacterium]|nr:methyltransferase domain-containing protein [Selenomonadaceae bacterium]
MKTSVILLVQDNSDNLPLCLQVLRKHLAGYEHEIVAVTGSYASEETLRFIAREGIEIISLADNITCSSAFNAAFRAATGEIIFFLRDNVILAGNAYSIMIKTLHSAADIGMVGTLHDFSKYHQQLTTLPVSSFETLADLDAYGCQVEATGKPTGVLLLEAFCFILKRSTIEATGLADENYSGSLGLEVDLTMRAIQAGYRPLVASTFVHLNAFEANIPEQMGDDDNYFLRKWGFYPFYSTGVNTHLLKMYDMYTDALQVLDIGCACGGLMYALRQRNPRVTVYGIEINPYAAQMAAHFGESLSADIEVFYRPDWHEKFDVIIMGDVIEHLKEPQSALAKVRDMLKSDGVLLTSIPNVAHISNIYNMLQGKWEYTNAGILDRTHLRFFTLNSIRKMFADIGFSIVEVLATLARNIDEKHIALLNELEKLPQVSIDGNELKSFQYMLKCVKKI